MLLAELLQEKLHWTVLELIDAINSIKGELKKQNVTPRLKMNDHEVIFEVAAGDDLAPLIKPHLKPYIIKTQYDREGTTHKYHYFLTRQLIPGELSRLIRSTNS